MLWPYHAPWTVGRMKKPAKKAQRGVALVDEVIESIVSLSCARATCSSTGT